MHNVRVGLDAFAAKAYLKIFTRYLTVAGFFVTGMYVGQE
jgi:hypothetical protein